MKKQKWYYIAFTVILAVLLGTNVMLKCSNKSIKAQLFISKNNEKALLNKTDSIKEEARVLQLTTEQLNYYNDYLLEDLKIVRDSLRIKDKNIKSLQYMASKAQRIDTICFRDTIFKYREINIDTVLTKDKWYTLGVSLKYPNKIMVSPTFLSEKYVIISTKKETVNPPKKFLLFRWFQKKHTIVKANIVEKNPYIENTQNEFIEILK